MQSGLFAMDKWLQPAPVGGQSEKENSFTEPNLSLDEGTIGVMEDSAEMEDITSDTDEDGPEHSGVLQKAQDQTQMQMNSFLVSELRALREGPVMHRFQGSARSYSSPLFNTLKDTQLSTRVFAARKCASRFSADALVLDRVRHSLNEEKQQLPVTVIKFDRIGALFAVGGVNGIVRVYDFDECLLGMSTMASSGCSGIEKCVRPVVAVDTRRAVSDLAWSLCDDDEISVCFSFRSDIHVYDLQDLSRPRQILQVGKNVSGGHNVIRYLKFPGRSGGGEQHVVAAGKSGHIRKWSITSSPHRVKWEVCADPNAVQAQSSPVVGLAEIEGKRLISITQSGVVTVWDLENMTIPAFGVSSLPSLILKVSLTGGDVCVSGMSFIPTHVSEILQNRSQDENGTTASGIGNHSSYLGNTLVQGQLLVTMAVGDLRLYDLLDNASRIVARRTIETAKPISVVSSSSSLLEMSGCLLHSGNSAPACPAVLPPFLGGQICCSNSGPSLCFYELGKAVIVRAPDTSSTSSVYGRLYRGGKVASKSAVTLHKVFSYVNFVPTFKPCYTLAGNVLSAEHGGREIIVTQIVDRHLCASELSGAYPSRSHEVYLDWSRGKERGQIPGAAYSIASIQPYVIILNQPYAGPTVEGGLPKVYIRTNLSASTDDFDNGQGGTGKQLGVCEHISRRECFISQAELVGPISPLQPKGQPPIITAIACHGRLPYIVIGRSNDTVVVAVSHEPRGGDEGEANYS